MVALALVAAMAFDIGMIMLERRDQQNAADAAALAGARCLNLPRPCDPLARAREVATLNGFTQGARPGEVVTVGASANLIQVDIERDLDSLFAGIVGRGTWAVSALAVAVNMDNAPPFASMIALSPDACPAFQVTGTGVVNSNGDIQVNSACSSTTDPAGDAFLISGQGNLSMKNDGLACHVVGDWSIGGKANGTYCDPPQPGTPLEWPISAMPSNTDWPDPPLQIGGTTKAIPNGCPGSTSPATDAAPATCQFQSSYNGTTWRLYPGYYPGGIKLQAGTFYMEPGTYHLAGGGFTAVATGVSLTSVDEGGTTLGGGILLFNTTHNNTASGAIDIGGNGNSFDLWPLGGFDEDCVIGPSGGWSRYLIFQDPAVTIGMKINGGGNINNARGLILAPTADVTINGGTGTLTIDAIIAWTFKINGNGGTINVLYDSCALPTFTGYGLIV